MLAAVLVRGSVAPLLGRCEAPALGVYPAGCPADALVLTGAEGKGELLAALPDRVGHGVLVVGLAQLDQAWYLQLPRVLALLVACEHRRVLCHDWSPAYAAQRLC